MNKYFYEVEQKDPPFDTSTGIAHAPDINIVKDLVMDEYGTGYRIVAYCLIDKELHYEV
jgi:hypothetical protein